MPESNYLRNPINFMDELKIQFNRMDADGDGVITRPELSSFLKKPMLDAEQQALGKFLQEHFDDLGDMTKSSTGIRKDGLNHLKEILAPDVCEQPPSATGTISRGAAGGAGGGYVTARATGDDSPGSAAGKGAAVGAVVGTLVYVAEKAQYNELVANQNKVVGWNYFDFVPCSSKPLKPGMVTAETKLATAQQFSDQVIDDQLTVLAKGAKHPNTSIEPLLPALTKFETTISRIDFDRTGFVTKEELKEAIANNYLNDDEKKIAAVLAKHASEISPGKPGISPFDVINLVTAADPHGADDIIDAERRHAKGVAAVAGAAGCFWGGIFGFAAGGMAPVGCGAGALLASGAAYYFSSPNEAKVRAEYESLRSTAFANTLADLKLLSAAKQNP